MWIPEVSEQKQELKNVQHVKEKGEESTSPLTLLLLPGLFRLNINSEYGDSWHNS